MPDYDESEYKDCLNQVSRKVDQYRLNIQVITAIWDFVNNTDKLSSSINGIEDPIWLEEKEKKVEPDFVVTERGEEYLLGEFKGRISQHEVDSCVSDIEKYTKKFYVNSSAVDLEQATPKSPKATFFITHSNHVKRISEAIETEYGGFFVNDVPVCFLSYVRYQGSSGQDRMRIRFEDGEINDSRVLTYIKEHGVISPDTNNEYHIPTLLMRAHTRDFFFYNAPPPHPYMAVELQEHLDNYRDSTDPASWKRTTTDVSLSEVIESFKENYSSDYTAPKSSWIHSGLRILEEYEWISIEDDSLTIYWEEFTKNRLMDDMHKFFAKERCKERATSAKTEGDEGEDEEEDEAQSEITDF